ncbi:NAD(P)H-dependent oxidoreductase [Actinomyces capricornis]|uniref:NAD(P)H dehydrogenase (Quinone) n=1 Tax=Actinomyces capricornis TaxID=2755559 RepID=A0ABM7U8W8_9ACTO|nr:NAD(P)H-dependent oxidoreductase [Actinomyces capricornis]BDA63877.1 NAD(P)H dehydrogenase (quinone) [Actinomyces capricornis]
MVTSSKPVYRALIVHAHPEPRSFSTAQAHTVAEQLRADGVETTLVDLYAEHWDPVLSADQFPDDPDSSGYFKPQAAQMNAVAQGSLGEPVASQLRLLQDSDLLILSFPLWWFSMPAILKGWVDRVLVMGAAFGGEHGVREQGGMRGKKAMVLLTTGGSQQAFAPDTPGSYGSLDSFLFHIHQGTLEFCGFEVLPVLATFGPAHLDGAGRAQALETIREGITSRLATEPA